MPDTGATQGQQEGAQQQGSEGTQQAPAKTTPEFVPSVEFKAFQDTMSGSMTKMAETLEGVRALIASGQKAPVTPAAEKTWITPAQYAAAVAEGNTEVITRWAAEQDEKRDSAARGVVEQVNQATTSTAEPIAMRVGTAGLKFYARFKDEIDKRVANLPPAVRANPDAYRQIHNLVVGEHQEELEKEATERVLRGAAAGTGGGTGATPGTLTARDKGTEGPKGTTPKDLGGEEAEMALTGAKKDADGMAKRMGYKDWADYMEKTKDYR